MAYENFNGNVMVPTSGCGASNLPGVAVYNPEVACPGAGYGASTYASPATALKIGLTNPIATFSFSSSAAARNVLFGSELSQACLTLLGTEVGGTVISACTDGVATLNRQAANFCCWLDSGAQGIVGFVAKTSDSISELSATQVLFDPCNPCFTSDTDFVCANGCNDNSNFILTNAVVGQNAGVIVTIPAGVALKIDVCSCAPEVKSFATCPTSVPAVASIPSAPACVAPSVPQGPIGQPGYNPYLGNRQF